MHSTIPRGFLHEILVVIIGFLTSLMPAWNYNPDDAAAFAAGQAIAAREDQQQQQGQQPGDAEAVQLGGPVAADQGGDVGGEEPEAA